MTQRGGSLSIRACSVVASTIFSIVYRSSFEIEKASFQFYLCVDGVDGSDGVI